MKRLSVLCCLGLALLCLGGLTGCSKPSINLAVASQPNVNPDFSGRPSPVIVKMYELRNDMAFNSSDFHPLFETPLQVLGADLIAADELVFTPGEARKVEYELNSSTRFIGLVAGFRQMERGTWRVAKPVEVDSRNWIAMELTDTSILLIPDKEAKKWEPAEAVRTYQQSLPQMPNAPQVDKMPQAPNLPAGMPSGMPSLPSQNPGAGQGSTGTTQSSTGAVRAMRPIQ